jgi:hypothetical protein
LHNCPPIVESPRALHNCRNFRIPGKFWWQCTALRILYKTVLLQGESVNFDTFILTAAVFPSCFTSEEEDTCGMTVMWNNIWKISKKADKYSNWTQVYREETIGSEKNAFHNFDISCIMFLWVVPRPHCASETTQSYVCRRIFVVTEVKVHWEDYIIEKMWPSKCNDKKPVERSIT